MQVAVLQKSVHAASLVVITHVFVVEHAQASHQKAQHQQAQQLCIALLLRCMLACI